jgi:hypothetical protein
MCRNYYLAVKSNRSALVALKEATWHSVCLVLEINVFEVQCLERDVDLHAEM